MDDANKRRLAFMAELAEILVELSEIDDPSPDIDSCKDRIDRAANTCNDLFLKYS